MPVRSARARATRAGGGAAALGPSAFARPARPGARSRPVAVPAGGGRARPVARVRARVASCELLPHGSPVREPPVRGFASAVTGPLGRRSPLRIPVSVSYAPVTRGGTIPRSRGRRHAVGPRRDADGRGPVRLRRGVPDPRATRERHRITAPILAILHLHLRTAGATLLPPRTRAPPPM